MFQQLHNQKAQNHAFESLLHSAARGWLLFPCRESDKQPLLRGWQERATSDQETIRLWAGEYPNCNWAVLCGRRSDLWVLDIDGQKGQESLQNLVKTHDNAILHTLTAKTGKGLHLYYRCPRAGEVQIASEKSDKA